MCFEPKYRAYPENIPGASPPDSPTFLPLLIFPSHAACLDNACVDGKSLPLLYVCLHNSFTLR